MAGMLGAPRNRIKFDVDNPIDSDGFYSYWRKRRSSPAGRGTTAQLRRRALRRKEERETFRIERTAY